MLKKISILIIAFLWALPALASNGKYGDPNAPFKDVCGGKIKNKQDYDLTFVRTRVLRTTYFCEDGTEEYYNTRQVKETKTVSKKSDTIVEIISPYQVNPGEITLKEDA